ncbi:hypothetical protein RAZWK3B_20426 [Roseobacter sp. AzwK-3b]|uniref:hypothetical protein n=1 Tax=Roseobacter sp. AzwK-3b TaxID=351016 RepID=UPI0001569994|nr:hypothetical protein [Roseobacter sp. AzwK-3b]EDM71756.1 hypothetical protein RAZWK3B_20426 [Roseobacter sp. AzwK-3b]
MEQAMALSNVLMRLRIYLGLLLLPFMAIPLFALDFAEGQTYCVGGGYPSCASVWTVKAIDPDGLVFEEEFRMTTPLNVMRWRQINWNVKRVRLTSRYAYEGEFLCEQEVLSSSFEYEIIPRDRVVLGRVMKVDPNVPQDIIDSYLNWRKGQQRCYRFGETCSKTFRATKGTPPTYQYTLREAFFYGNRDTEAKPWLEKPSYLVNQRREGDRMIRLLPDGEIDAETWASWRYVYEYLSWKNKHERLQRGAHSINYCSD